MFKTQNSQLKPKTKNTKHTSTKFVECNRVITGNTLPNQYQYKYRYKETATAYHDIPQRLIAYKIYSLRSSEHKTWTLSLSQSICGRWTITTTTVR